MKKEEILKRFRGGEFMSLTLDERRVVIRETAERYNKERKKEKVKILDEFVYLTGYNRCYASYVLRKYKEKKKAVIYGRMEEELYLLLIEERRIKEKKEQEKRYTEKMY